MSCNQIEAENILSHINVGIFVLDEDDKVVYWNNWLQLYTKMTAQNAMGKRVKELFSMSKINLSTFERLVKTALKLKSPTFFTADGSGYIFPIEIKKTSKRQYSNMQQDVTVIPHCCKDGYVTVFIYDQTTLMSSKEVVFLQSHYDSLTSLANRTLLFDRMDVAIYNAKRKDKIFAVFYLDIDKFKQVNDSYGHDIGDELLKQVSSTILSKVRKTDTVARLGGDEIVVVIDDLESKDVALKIATTLIKNINQQIEVENLSFTPSISMGVSFYPQDGSNAEELLKYADIALYKAKQDGRNNFKEYAKIKD
jgi:diguanylate cyclase (GGDEF)-like protein